MVNDMAKSDRGMRPIFLIGSGRSGTTILFELLHRHPQLAYVSNLTDCLPYFPQLAVLTRVPVLRAYKPFQPSIESLSAFDYCGITEDQLIEKKHSLTEQDVDENAKYRLQRLVGRHVRWQGKSQFINKNTSNTMRIRYLLDIFPDALFIHIIRNGYGVVNSLINVKWWRELNLWWNGETPSQWEAGGGNPYELAALHWKRQVTVALDDSKHVPVRQYLECRYEELLEDPKSQIERILRFCQLDWNREFERHFQAHTVRRTNSEKWRSGLDSGAKRAVQNASGDLLETLGYGVS